MGQAREYGRARCVRGTRAGIVRGHLPGQAESVVRAQWAHIRGAVAGRLLAHGCPERQALTVPAAMPGAAFFGR